MTTAHAPSTTGVARRRLGLRLGLGALAAVVISAPFTLLTVLVLSESETLETVDHRVADALNAQVLPRPALTRTLEVLSVVTNPNVWRLIALGIAIALWTRGRRRLVAWLVVTMTVGGLLGPGLKELVSRSRPAFEEPVTIASGYSFPSGHALNSMLFAGCLVVLAYPVTKGPRRVLLWAVAAVIVVVTAVDRIALGVHFLSDVLAGWVVALATVAATTVSFAIWRRNEGLPAVSADTGLDPADDDDQGSGATALDARTRRQHTDRSGDSGRDRD